MKKDLTKELLYLLAAIQLKTRIRATIKDLELVGLTIEDIKKNCELIKENKRYYHFYVKNDNITIGLTLIIYK